MHAHKNRAARFVARLGLETLESRTLLSATVLTPTTGSHTDLVQHSSTTTIHSQTTSAGYSLSMSIGPSAVITGTNNSTLNGRSTGMVMVALYRGTSHSATLGGAANNVPVGLLTTSSSATSAHPDHFKIPVSITLHIRDAASGKTVNVTFAATISGTLTWQSSTLTLTFQGPLTRQVKVGHHVYTVSIKTGSLRIPAPGAPAPALIGASIGVRNG